MSRCRCGQLSCQMCFPVPGVMPPTYWVSDCKKYIARVANGKPMPDVVEIATQKAWLSSRWKITDFDDPRCRNPQFQSQPVQWSNHGRRKRDGNWIEEFSVKIVDFDMSRLDQDGRCKATWQAEVYFRRQLPITHMRKRKLVDAAIKVAESYGSAILYRCTICSEFHPWAWSGDCRDDRNRFASPEEYAKVIGMPINQVKFKSMCDRLAADGDDPHADKKNIRDGECRFCGKEIVT